MVNITGKVVNYWTGKPVSAATVMMGGFMANTDADGNFRLENLPLDLYSITVIHKDYEKTIVTADLRVEGSYTIDMIKIKPIFRAL